jgi:hypothetical protein
LLIGFGVAFGTTALVSQTKHPAGAGQNQCDFRSGAHRLVEEIAIYKTLER